MRIISVVSGKGGVGKTTVTSNLGVVLASRFNKKVIVVDCNLSTPHLSLFLGMEYTPVTLNNVLRGEAGINEAIYNHPSGMRVVPSSSSVKDMHGIDVSLLEDVMKKLYNSYVGRADFMLLDCAPGLGREAFSGINAGDEILFVTVPYMPALMDVIRCNHMVREMGVHHTGVILNMTGKGRHELSPKEVSGLVGLPVIANIPSDKAILKSLSKRGPVTTLHPKSKSSKRIVHLASSLLKQSVVTPSYTNVEE